MTKKEKKILDKIEHELKIDFNNVFVQIMLDKVPFDEHSLPTVKIPTKKKMILLMNEILNPEDNLIIFGMISKFITTRYEVLKK